MQIRGPAIKLQTTGGHTPYHSLIGPVYRLIF